MKIIGLTGGIASGKSTAVKIFKQCNIPVCDTDVLARKVVEKGTVGLDKIVAAFGADVLDTTGELNRKKLGDMVFHNGNQRALLNEIVHPLIFEEIERFKQQFHEESVVVIDMPLLFEVGYDNRVDEILLIAVAIDVQKARLQSRDNLTLEAVDSRIAAQLPLKEKLKKAHVVIENNGTVEAFEKEILRYIVKNKCDIIK